MPFTADSFFFHVAWLTQSFVRFSSAEKEVGCEKCEKKGAEEISEAMIFIDRERDFMAEI